MKLYVFGKKSGSFTNDDGEYIEFKKVFAVKPSQYVEQISRGNNVVVGGECGSYSCLDSVFDDLPDDVESYSEGILCNVSFDDKKKIVELDLI